jgi:shikimate dehydrogenase
LHPRARSIFVLGSGGAARAVVFGLAKEGADQVYLYDLIQSKAEALARDMKKIFPRCQVISCKKKDISRYIKRSDLLVNCTPLGMKKTDPLPVDARLLHKGLKIYDIVYNPLQTRLLKLAKQKGIKAAGGLGMLLYQGVSAFELWTGKRAPVALMRKELIDNLI